MATHNDVVAQMELHYIEALGAEHGLHRFNAVMRYIETVYAYRKRAGLPRKSGAVTAALLWAAEAHSDAMLIEHSIMEDVVPSVPTHIVTESDDIEDLVTP